MCEVPGTDLPCSPSRVPWCWIVSLRQRLRALVPTTASRCCMVHCCGCTRSGVSRVGPCMPACGVSRQPRSVHAETLRTTGCAAGTITPRTFSTRATWISRASSRSMGYSWVRLGPPTTSSLRRRPALPAGYIDTDRPHCIAGAMLDGCTRMVLSLRTLTNKLPRTIYLQACSSTPHQ